MSTEQVVDGHKVQAAIDACYIWRKHVMKFDAFEEFKKKHNLKVVNESLILCGVYNPGGGEFEIVRVEESPYGVEFLPL